MTVLKVESISTYYGQFQALKEVSLRVDDGELVIIFGPNGHGKTTLLKTICGLLRPSSGSVKLGDKEIHNMQAHEVVEMGIVYIPEGKHLFPEMTVLDNLKLGTYNVNARRRQKEMLQYVFDLFPQLDRLKHRLACTLSGGEAQMLTIGRGLMSCPRFLAIDEPSLGLAP
ncbi:MAG TPA: ATP-binding cassette domain-containing protein, partial [Firmicutes bacterium]|nr:ATP-binding cassette domain-containing protein [Bacillota bacterium]